MRILTRYILFELLKVFLLTLTGFTLIIFVALIGKEAIDKGIGIGPLLQMTPYLLPQAMQFAVPATMLLAITSVFGRMSAYNEIVALKSLGISPMVVVWPAVILATLVSFVAVVLNDVAVSWGRLGVQRVFLASIEEVIYGQLRIRKTYPLGKVNILVRDVDGHKLVWPTLIVQSSGDEPSWSITAEEAELRLLHEEGKLVVRFYNFDLEGPISYNDPDTFEYVMSLDELTGNTARTRSPSTYALNEIGPAITEQEQSLVRIEDAMTAQTAFSMLTGDFDSLSTAAWQVHQRETEAAQTRLYRLHTEPWRRWANGFSCLSFVLIGVPVAMWLRFSEMLASFFVCFLPILIVYYPLIAVTVDQAKDGGMPPQAVWLGNILLSLAGVWLLRRVNRN